MCCKKIQNGKFFQNVRCQGGIWTFFLAVATARIEEYLLLRNSKLQSSSSFKSIRSTWLKNNVFIAIPVLPSSRMRLKLKTALYSGASLIV
jgi:hypothetical protein